MKKGMYVIIMLLAVCSVMAYWPEYGFDEQSTNSYTTDNTLAWLSTGSFETYAGTYSFQPIIADLDNDGNEEILISNNDYISVYQYFEGNIILKDSVTYGTVMGQPSIIDDYDIDDNIEFIYTVNGTHIYVLEYDGTALSIEATNTTTNSSVTGIICNIGYATTEYCFWGGDDGRVIRYDTTDNTVDYLDAVPGTDIFTTTYGRYQKPSYADYDRDGNGDLLFMVDIDDDDIDEGVMVFDIASGIDTGFSGDGIIEYTKGLMSGAVFANMDSAGDMEIVVSYREEDGTDDDAYVKVYSSDGTEIYTKTIGTTGNAERVSMPVIARFTSGLSASTYKQIFVMNEDDNFDVAKMYILSPMYPIVSNRTVLAQAVTINRYWNPGAVPIAVDLFDNGIYEVMTGVTAWSFAFEEGVGYYATNLFNHTTSAATYIDSHLAVGDLDGDTLDDIIGAYPSGLWIATTAWNIQAPYMISEGLVANIPEPFCDASSVGFICEGEVCFHDPLDSNAVTLLVDCDNDDIFEKYVPNALFTDRLLFTCTTGVNATNITINVKATNSEDTSEPEAYTFSVSNNDTICYDQSDIDDSGTDITDRDALYRAYYAIGTLFNTSVAMIGWLVILFASAMVIYAGYSTGSSMTITGGMITFSVLTLVHALFGIVGWTAVIVMVVVSVGFGIYRFAGGSTAGV